DVHEEIILASLQLRTRCIELFLPDLVRVLQPECGIQIGDRSRQFESDRKIRRRIRLANFTIGFELTTPISYLNSTFGLKDPYKIGKEQFYASRPQLKGREYYFFMNI